LLERRGEVVHDESRVRLRRDGLFVVVEIRRLMILILVLMLLLLPRR
jgi:hypothetical protein